MRPRGPALPWASGCAPWRRRRPSSPALRTRPAPASSGPALKANDFLFNNTLSFHVFLAFPGGDGRKQGGCSGGRDGPRCGGGRSALAPPPSRPPSRSRRPAGDAPRPPHGPARPAVLPSIDCSALPCCRGPQIGSIKPALWSPPPFCLFPGPACAVAQRQKLRLVKLKRWVLFISSSVCP